MDREELIRLFAEIPACVTVRVFGEYNTGCGDCEVCVLVGMEKVALTSSLTDIPVWRTVATRHDHDGKTILKYKDFDESVAMAVKYAESKK